MKAPAPKKAVFFDRDGTLMDEVHYCNDPAKVRAIPGAREALRTLREAGFARIIITNQSGIARGTITMDQYHAVQAELLRQLDGEIDAVYFCPETPENATHRRKPEPGMVEEASAELGLATAGSWFVGDKEIDLLCGRAAGLSTALVQTGYGQTSDENLADLICPTVVDAIEKILARPLLSVTEEQRRMAAKG